MGNPVVDLVLRITGTNGAAIYAVEELTQVIAKNAAIIEGIDADLAKGVGASGDAAKKSGKNAAKGAVGWSKYAAAAAAAAAATAASVYFFAQEEQALGGLEIVYGDSADEMAALAENAWMIGMSTAEAATAMTGLGALLQNLGIPLEATTELVEGMVIVAADLVAAYGGSVPDALHAMGRALVGEYDNIERYNISLNQAAVESQMLENETNGLQFATEQQAKTVAVLQLIQEGATITAGAAGDEYMTLSTATDRAKAATKDFAAMLGGILGPALTIVIDAAGRFIGQLGGIIEESGFAIAASDLLTEAFEGIEAILTPILIPTLEFLEDILGELSDFINKWVLPVLATLEEIFVRISTAIGNVIGWIDNLIGKLDDLIGKIGDSIDALHEFRWEVDEAEADMPTTSAAPASVAGYGMGKAPASTTVINITTGVGDPHAIAKEIRKILRRDEQRLGRSVIAWT